MSKQKTSADQRKQKIFRDRQSKTLSSAYYMQTNKLHERNYKHRKMLKKFPQYDTHGSVVRVSRKVTVR